MFICLFALHCTCVFVQTYNSREGFMNHRMSKHFVEFMQTSGPLMTDDVDLLEYTSLFPPPVSTAQCSAVQCSPVYILSCLLYILGLFTLLAA